MRARRRTPPCSRRQVPRRASRGRCRSPPRGRVRVRMTVVVFLGALVVTLCVLICACDPSPSSCVLATPPSLHLLCSALSQRPNCTVWNLSRPLLLIREPRSAWSACTYAHAAWSCSIRCDTAIYPAPLVRTAPHVPYCLFAHPTLPPPPARSISRSLLNSRLGYT